MRVIILVKSDEYTETGGIPDEKLVSDMMKFNEELVKAGVMQAAEGLYPSKQARRVRFEGGKATVIDGPFPEAKELVAGFWIWQVKSLDEAVDWVKRMPNPAPTHLGSAVGNVEIRQIQEMDDFASSYAPEIQEKQDNLRAYLAGKTDRSQ